MNSKTIFQRSCIFIFILPLVVLIVSFISKSVSGPFWQYGDPCYNYLFNAFRIIKGHSPTDITHPGTPLQIFVAFTIWWLNCGHSAAEAVHNALIRPEFYLNAVYVQLMLGVFLTSVILGFYVYQKTNDKCAVFLAQLMGVGFLILRSFDSGTIPVLPVTATVSAEPFFIIIMNLFNIFLLGLYFSDTRSQQIRHTFFLALVCGLGLATKINFAFILLAALLLVPVRQKILFVIVCSMSFVICTIPIWGKYPVLFQYITDMVSHSARYGTGDKKFIDIKSFLFFMDLMIRFDWFFIFSTLALFIWSSVNIIDNHRHKTFRFIGGLTACCLLHYMATAKHFSFHYLLPAFSLFGILFPLYYLHMKIRFKFFKPLAVVFILTFIGVCAYFALPYYKDLLNLTVDIRTFNGRITAKYPQCTVIPSVTEDINFFLNEQEAMQRANGFTFRWESDELYRLYPNSYYFFSEEVTTPDPHVESYGIWDYKERLSGDDILASCPCAIFTKYRSELSDYPYQFRLLEKYKYLNAFLLVASSEKMANELFAQALDALKRGDTQNAFMLGLKSRQLNYQPRGQLEYVLNIIYQNMPKK